MKILTSNSIVTAAVCLLLVFFGCNKESKLTVNTKEVTEITTNSAKCGGSVIAIGNYTIGACGVCWSETPSPTINDFFTTDIQGGGEFTSILKNLASNTKYYVRAYATTSSGIIYGEELDFTTETLPITTITIYTNDVSEITTSSAKCGGVVTANGDFTITTRGVCWNTSQNPTINDSYTSDGQGLGSFTSNLTGLNANTTYYIKAYAITSDGNIVYDNEIKHFSTLDVPEPSIELPTIEIGDLTDITSNSAKCTGNVISDGGATVTERGLCWNTSSNPMIYHSHTACGSGMGSFIGILSELTSGTTYYVRAYATNSEGTNYSNNEISFIAEQSSVTLSDFLGVFSVSAFNEDTQQYETWTGTNIATWNNPNTNTTWVKVEGLMLGNGYEYIYTALGEYDDEHNSIRLYAGWHFTSNSYHFYFNDNPDVLYYSSFVPIYQTTGTTWYYLDHGEGYENSGEAWLTMNSDGTISLGPSEYPDEHGRFANGFVFDYYKADDDSYSGHFNRYTDVKLTKTSKAPMYHIEQSIEVGNVKHGTSLNKNRFDNKMSRNANSINFIKSMK